MPASAIDAATLLGTAEASPGSTASSQNTSSENPSDMSAASTTGLRLSSAAVDNRPAGSEEPKTAPPVTSEVIAAREAASARFKRTRIAPLTKRSFVSFCNGKPRECPALPHLPGKTQQRAIIVCDHQPPYQRRQQRTLSRDPRIRRQLCRQRRLRRRSPVHAGLISVTPRRTPRSNKWRRPPPACHPSSLSGMSRRRPRCFCVSHASR